MLTIHENIRQVIRHEEVSQAQVRATASPTQHPDKIGVWRRRVRLIANTNASVFSCVASGSLRLVSDE